MKFILIYYLLAWFQMLKYKRAIEPMPWPQNINLTEGTFALSKSFKILQGNQMVEFYWCN
jgi:hexosaminidase